MTEVNHTFMHELNDGQGADVNTRMVPVIKWLNRLGVTTLRSHIDGEFAEVTFKGNDLGQMSELLFTHFKAMTDHLGWVRLELSYSGMVGIGVVEVRIDDLDDFSSRLGCWMDLRGK